MEGGELEGSLLIKEEKGGEGVKWKGPKNSAHIRSLLLLLYLRSPFLRSPIPSPLLPPLAHTGCNYAGLSVGGEGGEVGRGLSRRRREDGGGKGWVVRPPGGRVSSHHNLPFSLTPSDPIVVEEHLPMLDPSLKAWDGRQRRELTTSGEGRYILRPRSVSFTHCCYVAFHSPLSETPTVLPDSHVHQCTVHPLSESAARRPPPAGATGLSRLSRPCTV